MYIECWIWFEIVFWTGVAICVTGMTLNCIAVYLLHTKMRRNSANYMLKLLAVVYNLLLISLFLTRLASYLRYKGYFKADINLYYWSESFRRVVYMFSMYTVVIIASFRSLAIKFPHRAAQLWKKCFLHCCLFLMLIISVATEVKEFLYLVNINKGGLMLAIQLRDEMDLYHLIITCTLNGPVPIVIMVICLIYMLIHVKKHHNTSGSSGITSTSLSAYQEHMRQVSVVTNVQRMYQCHEITRMFCGVVVAFLLSHILLVIQVVL